MELGVGCSKAAGAVLGAAKTGVVGVVGRHIVVTGARPSRLLFFLDGMLGRTLAWGKLA